MVRSPPAVVRFVLKPPFTIDAANSFETQVPRRFCSALFSDRRSLGSLRLNGTFVQCTEGGRGCAVVAESWPFGSTRLMLASWPISLWFAATQGRLSFISDREPLVRFMPPSGGLRVPQRMSTRSSDLRSTRTRQRSGTTVNGENVLLNGADSQYRCAADEWPVWRMLRGGTAPSRTAAQGRSMHGVAQRCARRYCNSNRGGASSLPPSPLPQQKPVQQLLPDVPLLTDNRSSRFARGRLVTQDCHIGKSPRFGRLAADTTTNRAWVPC